MSICDFIGTTQRRFNQDYSILPLLGHNKFGIIRAMGTLEVTSKPLVILHGERKRKSTKRKKLEAKGYKVTDSAEWLGLSREEAQIVDMRVALAQELERVRKAKGITQAELAKRVGTKQSGVARMLNNPDTSTMDNLIKALIALGEPISKIAACLLLCSNN